MGRHLRGRGSWFGGSGDSSDSGHTASGGTTAQPGIAVYNQSTLGGFWWVRAPNGRKRLVRQTDIGPAPWTGRVIDLTYSVLPKFGYSTSNFPTDSGTFKARYLGKDPAAARRMVGGGSSGGGGGSGGGSRGPNPNQNVFDVGRRALPTPGGAGIVGLLNQAQTSPQPNVTAPLPEPATSARSALKMPAGYQTPGSSSSPAPKSGDSLSATLSAVASLGGVSVAHTPSSVRQGVSGAEKGSQGRSHGGTSGNTKVATMLHIAKKFDHARTTYLWGGGHGGFAHSSDRVDCSGYVSAILHAAGLISRPMTSGDMLSWGHPGRGKYVTVWTKASHVMIEINGRWFATSSSNPGGGPGEISRPDSSYLSEFTPRHPALP